MKKILLLLVPIILSGCDRGEEHRLEANKTYEEVKTTTTPGALYRVAESMKKNGNFEVAAKSYMQALQVDPTMTAAYLGLSQSLRL